MNSRNLFVRILFGLFCCNVLNVCSCYIIAQNEWPVRRKSPVDIMVDVTNNFGLIVLECHNIKNDNNIAFSPYGLMSVMIALAEGLSGEAGAQVHRVTRLPWDANIVRIGFRDIHRLLRSYFIPQEGFLAGLSLNNANVTFTPDYQSILRFYGYDLNPVFATTDRPYITELFPFTTPLNTESIPSVTTDMGTAEHNSELTTTESSTDFQTPSTSQGVQSTVAEDIPSTSTENMSEVTQTAFSTISEETSDPNTEVTTEIFQYMTETSSLVPEITRPSMQSTIEISGTTTEIIDSLPERIPATETSLALETTSVAQTTVEREITSVPETTPIAPTVSVEETVSTTEAISTAEATSTTETASTTAATSTVDTVSTAETSSPEETATTTKSEVSDSSTEIQNTDSSTGTVEQLTSIENIETTAMTTESLSIEPSDIDKSTVSVSETTIANSEPFTSGPIDASPDILSSPQMSSTEAVTENLDSTTIDPSAIIFPPERLKKLKRSVVDIMLARYYDNNVDLLNFHHPISSPPASKTDYPFLVHGLKEQYKVNYTEHESILPFAYLPNLNSVALKYPLDSSKYYLLLILPVHVQGVDKLICDLRKYESLRTIVGYLKDTYVKTIIPSFMLRGFVVLTNTLRRLGIRNVFEPGQADFTPMTADRDIYVTNIEQAVTVTIRNYMDENWNNQKRYVYNYKPVEFEATHPFLYFIMDSELNVALMAGKVTNPLNSRIY